MDNDILNLEQAMELLGVSEKTMIKLLREEHVPARKIGREWRFSREALIKWLSAGDSIDYINQSERYMIANDYSGRTDTIFDKIRDDLIELKAHGKNVGCLLKELACDITVPEDSTLRVSYKQQRNIEKLEFKIFWELREDKALPANQKNLRGI